MKRGGQHCIIYWIKSGYHEAFRINNHKAGSQIPLKRKSPNLFVNFEDHILRTKNLVSNEQKFDPGRRRFYLIIRDPFNLFASRFTLQNTENTTWGKMNYQKSMIDRQRGLWIDHAKVFLNDETSVVKINYNKWVASEDYRTELANRLSIKPHPYFVNYIPYPGDGSSFDYRKVPGQQMKVFDRWQQIEDNIISNAYMKIFTDEIIELSLRIFGNEFVSRIIDSKKWEKYELQKN